MEAMEQLCIKPDITTIKIELDVVPNPYASAESVFKTESDPDGTVNSDALDEEGNQSGSFDFSQISGKVFENGKKNRIQCPQCDNTFKNRANLKQHLKYVHSTKDAECEQCFRSFKSLAHLRAHKTNVHKEEMSVKCKFCDKVFTSKKRMNNHIFYTHPEPEESVQCTICSKMFKKKYNLKVHMRTVHPTDDKSVKCPHCDKTFKIEMLLQRHIKWSHPTDGMTYKCPVCDKMLQSLACYNKHVQNVHPDSQDAHCNICNKDFKTVKTLNRHLKTVHSEGKPIRRYQNIPCSECEKKFSSQTAMLWHFDRTHMEVDNEKASVCRLCNKDLADIQGLRRHFEMMHSVETATCHICNKQFKSELHMQRHIRITHAPPEAAQTCELCQKTFKCSMHLRIHINVVHSNAGLFVCELCNKEFNSRKYYAKHQKIHAMAKELPCLICGKLFKTNDNVQKHMKRVHFNAEYKCDTCIAVLTNYQAYKDHKSSCGAVDFKVCGKCSKAFTNDADLLTHTCNDEQLIPLDLVKTEICDEYDKSN